MTLQEKTERLAWEYPDLFDYLYRYICFRISNKADAEDIVADCFLQAYKKLDSGSSNDTAVVRVSYQDREGSVHQVESQVVFDESAEFYENAGIRKAVALSRYVNLMGNWIVSEREALKEKYRRLYSDDDVIANWEQESLPLVVSQSYQELFAKFETYLQSEIETIGDEEMNQELEIIKMIREVGDPSESTSESSW